MLAHAWGVKETVDPEQIEAVKAYLNDNTGSNITLDDGRIVTLLKGDIKEKSNEALLIYRYQLVGK